MPLNYNKWDSESSQTSPALTSAELEVSDDSDMCARSDPPS